MESVANLFGNAEPPAPEPTPAPEPKAKESAPPAKDESDIQIPKEFLEDKTAEPVVDEYEELIKQKPSGQMKHEHWERIKQVAQTKVDEISKERDALRAELEERKKLPLPKEFEEEITTLREAKKKADADRERFAYRESESYHKDFVQPDEQLRDQVRAIGKEYELDAKGLETILESKGRRRDEAVDELEISSSAKDRLNGLLKDIDLLDGRRQAALSRSDAEMKAIRTEEMRQQKAKAEAEAAEDERVWNKALETARAKLVGFRKEPGNDGWNQKVEENEALAKDYFSGRCSAEQVAEISLRGINSLMQDKVIEAMKKENAELKKTNAALTAANPGGGAAPGTKPNTDGMSTDQQVMASVAGLFNPANNGFGG